MLLVTSDCTSKKKATLLLLLFLFLFLTFLTIQAMLGISSRRTIFYFISNSKTETASISIFVFISFSCSVVLRKLFCGQYFSHQQACDPASVLKKVLFECHLENSEIHLIPFWNRVSCFDSRVQIKVRRRWKFVLPTSRSLLPATTWSRPSSWRSEKRNSDGWNPLWRMTSIVKSTLTNNLKEIQVRFSKLFLPQESLASWSLVIWPVFMWNHLTRSCHVNFIHWHGSYFWFFLNQNTELNTNHSLYNI